MYNKQHVLVTLEGFDRETSKKTKEYIPENYITSSLKRAHLKGNFIFQPSIWKRMCYFSGDYRFGDQTYRTRKVWWSTFFLSITKIRTITTQGRFRWLNLAIPPQQLKLKAIMPPWCKRIKLSFGVISHQLLTKGKRLHHVHRYININDIHKW